MKRTLREMAYSLDKILQKLDYHEDVCFEHLLKVYYHSDSQDLPNWITSIYSSYKRTYKDVKTNKYPTYEDLYNNLWGNKEDCYEDHHNSMVESLNYSLKDLPKIEDDIEGSQLFCKNYFQWLSKKFSTVGRVTLPEVEDKIYELLEGKK